MVERLKHIRAIHFALLIACAAIVIANSLPTARIYEAALIDARVVQAALRPSLVGPDGEPLPQSIAVGDFMRTYLETVAERYRAASVSPGNFAITSNLFPEVPSLGPTQYFLSCRPPADPGCSEPYVYRGDDFAGFFLDDMAVEFDRELRTLDDFRRFWDDLYSNRRFALIAGIDESLSLIRRGNGDFYTLQEANAVLEPLDLSQVEARDTGAARLWEYTPYPVDELRQWPLLFGGVDFKSALRERGIEYLLGASVLTSIWVPLGGDLLREQELIQFEINLAPLLHEVLLDSQRAFMLQMPGAAGWVAGPFDRSFPELNGLSPALLSADINTAVAVLELIAEDRRQVEGGDVSILGISIPTAVLYIWGGLAILAITLYHFLHLRSLVRTHRVDLAGTDFPWIGVYRDAASFWTFLLSSTVLPTGVGIFLFVIASNALANPIAFGASTAVAIGIFGLAALFVPEAFALRKAVRTIAK